jgi:acylphosphatase
MQRQAVRIVVQGRVQGVGYRWWAMGEARRLGIEGWVRNRIDGSVELLAIGSAPAIGRLVEACRRGPRAAVVSAVGTADAADDGSSGFEELPTA